MPAPLANLPVFDLATGAGREGFEAKLHRLRSTAASTGEAAKSVRQVLSDVLEHGDEGVVRHMRRFVDPDFAADRITVTRAEMEAADAGLTGGLSDAIDAAIDNVRAYQQHIMPATPEPVTIAGAELGLRWSAVDSAGLCVPGGTAVLFSTVIMLAVPAMVAGVDPSKIAVINPPPTRREGQPAGDISPIVLATCRRLGIAKVYRIGGPQAVAALAYGTESVEPVDMIAGPGNIFVQLAKAEVRGVTGTDGGFYGPSEIVTLADASADPRRVAADLIAQAEHDPGKCFLVAWDSGVIERVLGEVEHQLAQRGRAEAIATALRSESCAVLAGDVEQAVELVNVLAAEHVNLAVADPAAVLERVRHAGEVFLGDATPVAAGDYFAGPSHCLPTGTTARFTSGISVYTFLKRTGTVAYRGGMPGEVIEHIAAMAEAEGLDAHAASVRARG